MAEQIFEIIFQHGLYVIPLFSISANGQCTCKKQDCGSPGKHPLLRVNWKHAATDKAERIQQWMTKYETLNFAVATGRKSKLNGKYLVVLDIDVEYHELQSMLPKTFAYRTGGGGYHYWFWTDVPVKNSVSLVADKVDIRGTDGYVVIPPSKHKSGNNYTIIDSSEVADMPEVLTKLLKKAYVARKIQRETKIDQQPLVMANDPVSLPAETKQTTEETKKWTSMKIQEIRDKINDGVMIPLGVRNTTIHRLLSSDRAQGVLERDTLVSKASYYLKCLESQDTFSGDELSQIIDSVMKYPPYNTSHEKVNKHYVQWLDKNNHNPAATALDRLDALDAMFFSSLKKSVGNSGVSLKEVAECRAAFLNNVHGLQRFASYKPSLLGNKLRDLGFSRVRTAKCNVWNIALENVFKSGDL